MVCYHGLLPSGVAYCYNTFTCGWSGSCTVHVQAWEQAAVAVQQREGIMDTLLLVQTGVEDGSIGYLTISAIERQCVCLVQVWDFVFASGV